MLFPLLCVFDDVGGDVSDGVGRGASDGVAGMFLMMLDGVLLMY